MSDRYKQPESEAEYVYALRAAYIEGWRSSERASPIRWLDSHVEQAAREAYPITRKVPRVVVDKYGVGWRFDEGEFWRRDKSWCEWSPADGDPAAVNVERVRLWADLLANPTEEVTE